MDDLTAITERTEYYDIVVESEDIFNLGLQEKNPQGQALDYAMIFGATVYMPVGTQFLSGEPVQLWAEACKDKANIYLYRKDGQSELLLQNIPFQYIGYPLKYYWYLDRNGDFYCYCTKYVEVNVNEHKAKSSLIKFLSSGELLYETMLEPGLLINDLCQLEDGRIYLQLQDQSKNTRLLAEVDPSTGELIPESRKEVSLEFEVYLGSAGGGPAMTGYSGSDGNRRISKVDTSDGSLSPVMFFTGTSYAWNWNRETVLQDFRVLENGQLELLWTNRNGTGGLLERLKMEKVKKIPIVVRGVFYGDSWITRQAALFNSKSSTYHVIIEDCGDGNDTADFAKLTNVQIGAGKGPDILCGDRLLRDYIGGMLEKGALEELHPYMEASGIREEDYFPLTFSSWRQGDLIYGVNPRLNVIDEQIVKEVLGSRETPDIETLADALLSYEKGGIYAKGLDSGQVLNKFLRGTDSLWGMVDWENGCCDFNTPLFRKLLEAAMRYGDDGRRNSEFSLCGGRMYFDIFSFMGQEEQENAGMVTSGILFDDGCHTASWPWYTMAINGNSLHKETAWEFICFLINEEAQTVSLDVSLNSIIPVHRKAFDNWLEEYINCLTQIYYVDGIPVYPIYHDIEVSEEKKEEYKKAIEDARPLPIRTAPILTIIREDAEDYFNGSKSADEVIGVINNRVQLYLNERK